MPVTFPFAGPIVPATARNWRDDVHFIDNDWNNHFDSTTAGTASVTPIADTSGAHLGRVQLSVTSAGTGSARIQSNEGIIGLPPFFSLWQTNFSPAALSDGTNRFYMQMGFTDTGLTSDIPANGFGFRYSDNINSGRWQCFSASGGVASVLDSGQAANITKNTFRVYSPGAAGPLIFLVNDRLVGAIRDNIPTVAGFFSLSMFKSVGAAARTAAFDYLGYYYVRGNN